MGDVLHGMPAIAALRAAWPDAHIAWAIEPRWSVLLQASTDAHPFTPAMPLVNGVHPAKTRAWSKRPLSLATLQSIQALRHALRSERYGIAIDLQGTIRSAVIARMSGAARVIGPAHPKEAAARLLYTERVVTCATHVIDQAAEIVSAAAGQPLHPIAVPLPVDQDAERWCDILLQHATGPFVLIAPTAGWRAKQWPATRFGQLAARLAIQGCRVLVNASPDAADPIADQVIAASNGTAERAACTLPQLIALTRRMHLAIVGDSGPLHLAAALDIPVIALFGPTDPARNGPYGTRRVVLRHQASITTYRHTPDPDPGLLRITVEEVLHVTLRLLPDGGTARKG